MGCFPFCFAEILLQTNALSISVPKYIQHFASLCVPGKIFALLGMFHTNVYCSFISSEISDFGMFSA